MRTEARERSPLQGSPLQGSGLQGAHGGEGEGGRSEGRGGVVLADRMCNAARGVLVQKTGRGPRARPRDHWETQAIHRFTHLSQEAGWPRFVRLGP